MNGTLRYSELKHLLPQATPKMLTQQLRELEKDAVIHRDVYPVVSQKTEYSLIKYGQRLFPIIQSMCSRGTQHMSEEIHQAN